MKSLKHKRNLLIGVAFLAVLIALAVGQSMLETTASASVADGEVPTFEVDPMWPKPLPNHWIKLLIREIFVASESGLWAIRPLQFLVRCHHFEMREVEIAVIRQYFEAQGFQWEEPDGFDNPHFADVLLLWREDPS